MLDVSDAPTAVSMDSAASQVVTPSTQLKPGVVASVRAPIIRISTLGTWVFLSILLFVYAPSIVTVVAVITIASLGVVVGLLTRKTYEFYDTYMEVTGRGSHYSLSYSDVSFVRLFRGGIYLGLKTRVRGVTVPGNPSVGGEDLYSWLRKKLQPNQQNPSEEQPAQEDSSEDL